MLLIWLWGARMKVCGEPGPLSSPLQMLMTVFVYLQKSSASVPKSSGGSIAGLVERAEHFH